MRNVIIEVGATNVTQTVTDDAVICDATSLLKKACVVLKK